MGEKSKILVIGGTGYFGKFIVPGSAKAGHPTFALVRESSLSDPVKGKLVQSFKDLGVHILHGDINDHESLVKAIKQVDVVISVVGSLQIMVQAKIISAIKEAGNVKRYLPSEFGTDVDHTGGIGPAKLIFAAKAEIRRAIEAEDIPHTFVVSNCCACLYVRILAQPDPTLSSPPRDKVIIYGDGNAKAIINKKEDIVAYTMKAIDDPRTLNKILYVNPPENIISMNDLVALWEKKIGKTLEKTYLSEEQMLDSIQESPTLANINLSICHSVFLKGVQMGFTIDPSFGVEASELYPDVKYTNVEGYLDQFV